MKDGRFITRDELIAAGALYLPGDRRKSLGGRRDDSAPGQMLLFGERDLPSRSIDEGETPSDDDSPSTTDEDDEEDEAIDDRG